MKLTKQQLLDAWLTRVKGGREVPSRSRKYRTYIVDGVRNKVFTGKAGALRIGKNVSNSIAVPHVDWTLIAAEVHAATA